MWRMGRETLVVALAAGLLLSGAACSKSGGKRAEQENAAVSAGKADTPRMTIAKVTHAGPGQTFWDIVRKGAEVAATKDNVELRYSSDPASSSQAVLIQSAIDAGVDGIAVTMPDPPALEPAVKKAVAAGIPVVALNAGIGSYQSSGAMAYFGSDETVAGEAAGTKAGDEGAPSTCCV